jgi:hypothetical protein
MRTRNSIFSFFVILLCSFSSFGANISWKTNTTGDWNVGSNWVGNVVPGLGDYAMLNPGAGFTVTVNSNETLQGVRVLSGTLQVLSGSSLNLTQGTANPCIWHQATLSNFGTINISNGTTSGIQCQGTIVNDGSININSITNQGINFLSGTISNSGQLFINGLSNTPNGNGIIVSGTSLTNTGNITIGNTAALAGKGIVVSSGMQFINSGSIIIDNCGNIGLQNIGTFTNSSGANIEIGLVSHCNHRGIDNSGTFTNSSGASIEIDDVQNEAIYNTSGTFTNYGTFIQQATTFFAIKGAGGTIINETTGQIYSSKTIEGNFFNNKGTLNPGNSPGILQINNSFVNSGSSNFNIEIGGTTAGTGYDQVNFQNAGSNANISNTALNVSYISGYAPVGGESFDIIIGSGFAGTFNSITRPAPPTNYAWTDVYTSTTFTMSLTAVAPLDLIEFEVKLDADQVLLNWLTVNESDMRGFEIERSYDLNNWENIKFVEAVNKMSENKYYCQDKPAIQKMVYYRLKIISNDGQYKYSKIKSLQLENKREISVYPNPVSDKIFLDINEPITKIRVFDIIGNQYNIKFDSNTIDTESLISGDYLLFIDDFKPIIFVKKK